MTTLLLTVLFGVGLPDRIYFGTAPNCPPCVEAKEYALAAGTPCQEVQDLQGPWIRYGDNYWTGLDKVKEFIAYEYYVRTGRPFSLRKLVTTVSSYSQIGQAIKSNGPMWEYSGNLKEELVNRYGYSYGQLEGLNHNELLTLYSSTRNGHRYELPGGNTSGYNPALSADAQATPWEQVDKALSLLSPKPHETFADFGCGGR